jgi:hypothetical protein
MANSTFRGVTEFDRAAYLKDIGEKIARHGHAVQQVAGADGEPGWSYTVGLHAAGLPELIIIGGLARGGQVSVLNRLAERMRSGEALHLGERDPDVLEGVDVTYIEVVDTTTSDFAVALKFASDFRALQVVWPDHGNRFPWEPGYSFARAEQRLLGLPPA